ncbi:SPOSA6832_00423, partial [Sporobolomyces salmonicolor]
MGKVRLHLASPHPRLTLEVPTQRKYFFSTHFWGPLANWGLPLAAIADLTSKEPKFISGPMTLALASYSCTSNQEAHGTLGREQPGACNPGMQAPAHATNATAQTFQGARFLQCRPDADMGGKDQDESAVEKVKEAVMAAK